MLEPLAIAIVSGRGGSTKPSGDTGNMPAQVMKCSASGGAIVAVGFAVLHRAPWLPLLCIDGVVRLFAVLPVHCGERQALLTHGGFGAGETLGNRRDFGDHCARSFCGAVADRGGASVLVLNVCHYTFSPQGTGGSAARFRAEEPGRAAGWLDKFAPVAGGASLSAINTGGTGGAPARVLQAPPPTTSGGVTQRLVGPGPPATLHPEEAPIAVHYVLGGLTGPPLAGSGAGWAARVFTSDALGGVPAPNLPHLHAPQGAQTGTRPKIAALGRLKIRQHATGNYARIRGVRNQKPPRELRVPRLSPKNTWNAEATQYHMDRFRATIQTRDPTAADTARINGYLGVGRQLANGAPREVKAHGYAR